MIKAVKGGLRFRTYDNILLARLAVTDVLTSLFGQPLYVLWRIFLMFGLSYSDMVENFHYHVMTIFVNASCLHLHGLMITLQTSLSRLYKFYRYGASLRAPCELRFYSLLTYLFVIWNGWEVNILSQHPIGGILIESKQPFECCKWQITLSAFMPPLFLFQHRWSIKALTWWNIIFLFTSFSVLLLWYTCIFNIFPIMLF